MLSICSKKKNPDTVSTGNLLAGPKTQTINLKSGWDEMLSDTRKAKGFLPRIKTKSASSYTLSISPEPWSPSSHKTTFRDDDTFMSSTLSYLGSPVAQTLGLNSPSACAPCALSSPVQTQPPKEPPRTYAPADIPRIIKPIPDDAKSTISSLWDKPWPQPPATIPIPSPSSPTFQSRSQMATTPGSASQVVYPAVVPPNLRTSPFEGACISPGPHSPVVPKAALSRRPSMKDLRENGDVAGYAPHEVIYMTPIRETV
jgi:pheromone a factor receptor